VVGSGFEEVMEEQAHRPTEILGRVAAVRARLRGAGGSTHAHEGIRYLLRVADARGAFCASLLTRTREPGIRALRLEPGAAHAVADTLRRLAGRATGVESDSASPNQIRGFVVRPVWMMQHRRET